jgi:hypothetical protein
MKYFTLIIVAILFGAAGWSLRGEWGTDGGSDRVLEESKVSFPLNMKQEAMSFLEGKWSYHDSPALIAFNQAGFVLSLKDDEGVVTGDYEIDSIHLSGEDLEFRVYVFNLKYPEEMLEEMKKDSVENDLFGGGDKFDENYFNETYLKECFSIIVNDRGETRLSFRHQGWIPMQGMGDKEIFRK